MIASDPQHRSPVFRRCLGCAAVVIAFVTHEAAGAGGPYATGSYYAGIPHATGAPHYPGAPHAEREGYFAWREDYPGRPYPTPDPGFGLRRPEFSRLAFQDPLPMTPAPREPAPMEPMLMGDPQLLPEPDSAAAAQSGEADRVSEAERLGTEPESNNLSFLRRQTVLLEPGEWQYDIGFIYNISENQPPVALTSGGVVVGVVGSRVRQRLLTCPFEVRLGVHERMQMFWNMPVGWSGTQFSFSGFDDAENIYGVGDLRWGASVLIKKAKGCSPDVIGTFDITFPTGNDNFGALGLFPGAQLGEGFYALSASLLCIHTYDPVVLFYGGGYRHRFDDPSMGFDIDPGEQFFYQMGVGFAINERITLSASFLGVYVSKVYVNDMAIAGSNQEPMRMRFSVTILNPDRCLPKWRGLCKVKEIVEPFAEIGMTEDSPDARFGIVWTY